MGVILPLLPSAALPPVRGEHAVRASAATHASAPTAIPIFFMVLFRSEG